MRTTIESDCNERPLAAIASAYGLSEIALESHIEEHGRESGVVPVAPHDEPMPDTLRSPEVAA